jgi:alcohol dehydrogenase class IV
MLPFEFASAGRIVFGRGVADQLGGLVAPSGRRVLLVHGASAARAAPHVDRLRAAGCGVATLAVAGEPTVEQVRAGVAQARAEACEVVVSVGGGSALDAGKAIAMLLGNGGDPLDYLEVVGRGRPIDRPSAPFIAVPTTAGPGAEVTRNAVLRSVSHGVKASLRSPHMLPRVALVDPLLTVDLPPAVTAATGLDALAQLIEPFLSHRVNPLTDALCREGIPRSARSLVRACENGGDLDAREDLALASLFGGLALANAGLGAVHGFAAVLGGRHDAPHGALCAALLPGVLTANRRALAARAPQSPALARFAELGERLCGDPSPDAAAGWAAGLCARLDVARLSAYGVTREHLPDLITASRAASSMKGNPITLTDDELLEILDGAL